MSTPTMDRERAEIERSATEATHADPAHFVADETQVARYLDPPANTCYPLEYSFHLLGSVRGKTVLEYGCGDGINTLVLARRGANVKALDISPDLVNIARQRLIVNNVTSGVDFIVGSAHDLPLSDGSVDLVFGIAILHHLDLNLSACEVKRVLRRGGRAIFQEPIRNSRIIQCMRGLIPYKSPDVSPFERPLTDKELFGYASGFSSFRSKPFTLPSTNLVRFLLPFQGRLVRSCFRWDARILQKLPTLGYYASVRVIEIVK